MNRFVFGTALVALAPVLASCSNFYITAPPAPLPIATPAPTPVAYPFDPLAGTGTTLGPTNKGIAMNGTPTTPTSFRVADVQDIQFNPRTPGDTANSSLLLVLQPINSQAPVAAAAPDPRAGASAATAATSTLIGGTKDVSNPVRLAGVLVPGPVGPVGGGLQDPDQLALQQQVHTLCLTAISRWVRLTGTFAQTVPVAGTTPLATPTLAPTATPAPRARRGRATPTPIPTTPPIVDPSQLLDVYQDPKLPLDSDSRPLVQVFFKSAGGGGNIAAGTQLSLNRMLIRSGLAVVDLYSPTSFDQATWILDEAYARKRRLGLWGLQLNGKTLSLQQRVPVPSSGTGASSRVTVQSGVPIRPGQTGRGGAPVASATQSPTTLTPTLAPPAFPRVVTSSGSKVQRGSQSAAKLPPPSDATTPATGAAPSTGAPTSSLGNSASGPGLG